MKSPECQRRTLQHHHRQIYHCQKAYSNKTSLWVMDFICEFMTNSETSGIHVVITFYGLSFCSMLKKEHTHPCLGWRKVGASMLIPWAALGKCLVLLHCPFIKPMIINWALILMFFEDLKVPFVVIISAALWVRVLFIGFHWLFYYFYSCIKTNP